MEETDARSMAQTRTESATALKTASSSQLVRYLHDCYRADNRETVLHDFFAERVERRIFLKDRDEVLEGLFDLVKIDSEKGLAAMKAAAVHKKEKSLVYATFFIVGRTPEGCDLPKAIAAPLLFFPARIEEKVDVAYLSVDFDRQRVNFPLLAQLLGETESGADYLEDVAARLPTAPFDEGAIGELIGALEDCLPELQVEELYRYPELCSEKDLRARFDAARRSRELELACLPAGAIALIRN